MEQKISPTKVGRWVGVFHQKKYIKDKITIASCKNVSGNKISESFGWGNAKKSSGKRKRNCFL